MRLFIHWPIHWIAFLIISGCQAYTIPSRATSVAVQTISLPPQWAGMESDLTRELVMQLQSLGYQTHWATTSPTSDSRTLRCVVDLKATQTPQAMIMDALLVCDSGKDTVQQRGQSSVFGEDSRAAFDASKDAIGRALPQLDSLLQAAP